MNRTIIVVAIIVGAIIFIGGFILIRNFIRSIANINITPGSSPTPTITENVDNWKEYVSSVFDYSIKYPPEGFLDNPTSDGSEVLTVPKNNVNEGVKLTFRSDTYGENNLMSFVNSRLEGFRNNPVVNFTSEIEPIDMVGLSGYKFDITTNQMITYIFLQKGQEEYFQIINETLDPNNKGYINLADEILNTLKIEVSLPTT